MSDRHIVVGFGRMNPLKSGYVYLWWDTQRNKYYLGSHAGSVNDGYLCSCSQMKNAIKKRPQTIKFRILENVQYSKNSELRVRETAWLSLIKENEMHGKKYYNSKLVAAGGDIISTLSIEKKKQHKLKSGLASKKFWTNISKDDYEFRKRNAFGGNKFSREYLKQRNKDLCSKTAKLVHKNGTELIIRNVAEFCKTNKINYGNMKSVLRGNTTQKSAAGWSGCYV